MDIKRVDLKKSCYQIQVRIANEELHALKKLKADRKEGNTISDIVRGAIKRIVKQHGNTSSDTVLEAKIKSLAALLRRDPEQVGKACIEGIFDLIENKTRVPLIVVESQLHLSYESQSFRKE